MKKYLKASQLVLLFSVIGNVITAQPSYDNINHLSLWCDTLINEMEFEDAMKVIGKQAESYADDKKYDHALNCYYFISRSLYNFNQSQESKQNVACLNFLIANVYALKNSKDSAFKYLFIERKYNKCAMMHYLDLLADFSFLKSDHRWIDLSKTESLNQNDSIANELATMLSTEQHVREKIQDFEKTDNFNEYQIDSLYKKMRQIDSINNLKIKSILKLTNGFPSKSIYGEKACLAAFLILQHVAWDDPHAGFKIINEAYKKGDINPQMWALFYDRYQVVNGKKQLYGTQSKWDEVNKKHIPFPIESPNHVNERRKQMGMNNIEEYYDVLNKNVKNAK